MTPLALIPEGPARDRVYLELRHARGGNHGFLLWHAQDAWTSGGEWGLERNWGKGTVTAVRIGLALAAAGLGALLVSGDSDAL